MTTTVGQILVNDALPPELRDYARTLGKDETDDILGEIARTRPDEYRDICKRLVDLGRNGAFDEGATITLGDLVPVVDKKPMLDLVRRQSAAIRASRRLSESEKDDAIAELYDSATKRLTDETYTNALAVSNPFALQAKFKARGNKNQLGAMLTSPGTYTDSEGNIVPIFIGRSYAEGLRPHEYWAASYGARLGVTCLTPDTKVVMGDWTEREIGSLRPGDVIMGARRDGTIYPVRVKHFFDNGIQPVYRWTFRCLSSQAFVDVKATAEHKLLARVRRWGSGGKSDPLGDPQLVRLGSAKFGSRPDHNSYFAQVSAGGRFTGRHVDTALLLGLMTGDGCCSDGTSTRMSFSCADSTLLADIKEYLAGLNLRLTRTSGAYTHTFSRVDKIPHEWYYSADGHKFNNRARYEIWRYIGGCHSWDKKIPHDIMQWDDESVIAYMAGLFATDGSFYRTKRNTISFSLALNSLSLVEAVKRILELRFGVWCSPVHDMQKSRAHHMYGIVVSHPDSFERLARLMRGVIPGVKRVKLEELHASKTAGRTPDIGFRIQSVEYLGEQHVVDIEVDSQDHMFLLANGIISSNSTKLATQKGGYLAKMLNSASIDQVVTEDDCGTENGIPVKSDDADSIGAVLQEAVGGFKPGTVITKSVLDKIRASGVDEFMVRSPITCACKDGLCKRCVGIRETGRFPDIGYNVGITAASALGEQIAQNSLNCIAEGTLVRMADMSVKPIERIEPGEYVLGCGLDGFLTPSRVVARYDNGIQPCVSTRFVVNGCHKTGDGPILVSTRVHPILGTRFVSGQRDAVNNFKPRVLEVGTRSKHFYAYSPKCSHGNITVYRRVEQLDVGDRHVYDLEIDHPDHLYLLANGLVVHNSKHSGKRNDLGSYVGFDALKNLTTIPNTYDVKASVARRDGVVTSVEKAPQGGSYVILDGSTDPDDRIYVPASLAVTSKVGDRLEAGDAVSQGLVSPADVVAYKGIGEGRRYFTNRMRKVFQDSKYGVSRRNVEVLARSLINNVRVDRPDSEGPGLPGDILRYSAWVQGYSPREGASEASPDKSVGRYLERPVMHYTVGTRITPNVVASMKRHGVQRVLSNETAPGVSPHMVSVVEAPAYSGDWMARLGTSYLKDRLLEDAQNVSTSKTHSTNPIPALAKGVEFGDDIEHGVY